MDDRTGETPSARTDARVTELEIRSSFQEQRLQQLDEVVREFADRVVQLEHELAELRAQVQRAAEERAIGPADERPPHY